MSNIENLMLFLDGMVSMGIVVLIYRWFDFNTDTTDIVIINTIISGIILIILATVNLLV